MKTSEDITLLAAALAKAQPLVEGAKKDQMNPAFKKSYADLGSVWEAIQKPMADNGLSLIQFPVTDGSDYAGVVSRLLHESGQWMEEQFTMPVVRADPQAFGSAFTYARRYAAMAIFGVCPEDDDGNGASGSAQNRPQTQWGGNNAPADVSPPKTRPMPEPDANDSYAVGQKAWASFWLKTKELHFTPDDVHAISGKPTLSGATRDELAALLTKLKEKREKDGPPQPLDIWKELPEPNASDLSPRDDVRQQQLAGVN